MEEITQRCQGKKGLVVSEQQEKGSVSGARQIRKGLVCDGVGDKQGTD